MRVRDGGNFVRERCNRALRTPVRAQNRESSWPPRTPPLRVRASTENQYVFISRLFTLPGRNSALRTAHKRAPGCADVPRPSSSVQCTSPREPPASAGLAWGLGTMDHRMVGSGGVFGDGCGIGTGVRGRGDGSGVGCAVSSTQSIAQCSSAPTEHANVSANAVSDEVGDDLTSLAVLRLEHLRGTRVERVVSRPRHDVQVDLASRLPHLVDHAADADQVRYVLVWSNSKEVARGQV